MGQVVLSFTNKPLGNKSLKNKHGVAVSVIDIPDIRVGDPGGLWRGASILLWTRKVNFRRAPAVFSLQWAPVGTGCLVLLQLFNGDHVAGVVFAAGHLLGFPGGVLPARCQVVLESAERDTVVRVIRASF